MHREKIDGTCADTFRLLVEQVIAGHGLGGVVRVLATSVGLPTGITNEDLERLHAYAPCGKPLPAGDGELPPEVRTRVSFDLSMEPRASTAPPTLSVPGNDGREYVVAPVVLPTGVLAYLWAGAPTGEVSPHVPEVVAQAAAACAVEMVRQRAEVEGESRVRASFLEDLLLGEVVSSTGTRRRGRFLGYDLRGPQVVFVLDLDRFSGYIDAHGMNEAGIQHLKDRFRRSLDGALPALWSCALVWEHSDSLVVLVPAGKQYTTGSLRERIDGIRATVQERLGGPGVSAGIGRVCQELTRLPNAYREAAHALMIGTEVHGVSCTCSFEELGAYRLLYHLRDHPELSLFCEESIGALEKYDQEHNSALVETLGLFLHLQGNLSQTARQLHLHRNGLLYRLARIEAIAHCDLSDPSQRVSLHLAFLARPLVKRSRGA